MSVFTSFVLVVSHPKRNIASFREMHRPTARGTWGSQARQAIYKGSVESPSPAWRSPECRSRVPSPRSSGSPSENWPGGSRLCAACPQARGRGPAASAFPVSLPASLHVLISTPEAAPRRLVWPGGPQPPLLPVPAPPPNVSAPPLLSFSVNFWNILKPVYLPVARTCTPYLHLFPGLCLGGGGTGASGAGVAEPRIPSEAQRSLWEAPAQSWSLSLCQ